MKNAGKQNETELEWIDKGNAKEKYKGKEKGTVARKDKTLPRIQNTSQNPKTFPRIQNTSQNPKTLPRIHNNLVKDWKTRVKYVDDLSVLEIIPRCSTSMLPFVARDICSYASSHGMKLNPSKCKELRIDFL